MKDIGIVEFIKSEMEKRGMTYDQLAVCSGMSKQNLWDKLNKRVAPNFGNVKKILGGLNYSLTIERSADAAEVVGDENLEKFFQVADEEQVSYECVEKLLAAMGYELKLETQ